jgi:hypothetical protein
MTGQPEFAIMVIDQVITGWDTLPLAMMVTPMKRKTSQELAQTAAVCRQAALKERDLEKRKRLQKIAIGYEALSKDRERDERAS